jgi:hypothetical protein
LIADIERTPEPTIQHFDSAGWTALPRLLEHIAIRIIYAAHATDTRFFVTVTTHFASRTTIPTITVACSPLRQREREQFDFTRHIARIGTAHATHLRPQTARQSPVVSYTKALYSAHCRILPAVQLSPPDSRPDFNMRYDRLDEMRKMRAGCRSARYFRLQPERRSFNKMSTKAKNACVAAGDTHSSRYHAIHYDEQ